jgi:hypothetical protein
MFQVVQITIETAERTGKAEYYLARGKKDAARKLLYRRRVKDGRCRLGPTGLVVSCPDGTAWVITKRQKRTKKR